MTTTGKQRFFDLHCDTITKCLDEGKDLCGNDLHISLDRFPQGNELCQVMAVFIPDNLRGEVAQTYYRQARNLFYDQLRMHSDIAENVRTAAEVDEVLRRRQFALMLSVEGGCVLAGDIRNLEGLRADGVRIITLTWNGENELCGGCATDLGFTPFGREAVAGMEACGIAVDVSHLSDKGFWELCEFARRPFIASHSNSRVCCNHRRNLTDEMFGEIVRRGGIVGINFYEYFLAEDGKASVDDVLRHVHHFLELGGENTVALGSDYDGADVPGDLAGFEKLPWLRERLLCSGIPEAVVQKIVYGNALRYFSNRSVDMA